MQKYYKKTNDQILSENNTNIPVFSLNGLLSSLNLKVDSAYIHDQTYCIVVSNQTPFTTCPYCGCTSSKCHSRYTRMLYDLPISEYKFKLFFHARKLFCTNPNCKNKTFAEQPCKDIQPYQRNTKRFKDKLVSLAACMSSNQAARYLCKFDREISGRTLLRYIKTLARGIRNDFDAVRNALIYEVSNDVVEGYVNKVKTFKRIMYGRTSVELLERKMYLNDYKAFN